MIRVSFLLPLAAAFSLALSPIAHAEDGNLYLELRGFGGWTDPGDITATGVGTIEERNTDDLTAGAGFAIGWTFGDLPLRLEGEIMHRVRTDVDLRDVTNAVGFENNLDTTSYMVGAAYEFRNETAYTPFIGGHIGFSQNTSEVDRTNINNGSITGQDNTVTDAAFAASLGVDANITEVVDFTAFYRFSYAGSFETGTLSGGESIEGDPILSHDLVVGVRFNF